MRKVYLRKGMKIDFTDVVCSATSPPDWEMDRVMYLDNNGIFETEDGEYIGGYVIADGGHCSCYGFEETEWHFMSYTKEELMKIADMRQSAQNPRYIRTFWKLVEGYVGGRDEF